MSSRPKSTPGSFDSISSSTRRENTYTPIDAVNGCASLCWAKVAPSGMLRPISCSLAGVGFSSNATMRPSFAKRKMPICVASSAATGCAAMVMSARCSCVRVDQLAVIHPIQVVAGQNQDVIGLVRREVPLGLPHGVGGSLIPVRVVGRLLGRENLDEAAGENVELIGVARCDG